MQILFRAGFEIVSLLLQWGQENNGRENHRFHRKFFVNIFVENSTKTINTKCFDFEVELTFIFSDVNKKDKYQEKTSFSLFSPYQTLFTW